MTKSELYTSLKFVNHSIEKRAEMASLITNNPQLIIPLLQISIDVNNPISSRACWVLEFTAKENLAFIFPHLDLFTENLSKVHLDSSVRPFAKICLYLISAYFSKTKVKSQTVLTNAHLEMITASCFDWLIGDHKVAAKAYSMTSLLLLGRKFKWINPELKMILEQNYAQSSAAFKARARMTLSKLS